MNALGTFVTRNPVGKLLLDLAVGGIIGASTALLALPGTAGADVAVAAVVGGWVNGVRSVASSALIAAIAKLRETPV